MKILSKYIALIGFLLVTQMCFGSSILGSFAPTYQYFKVIYSNSIENITLNASSKFMQSGNASCGSGCSATDIITTPKSSKGGSLTIYISTSVNICQTQLVLPLTIDANGNVETNDTSYQAPLNSSCTPSSFTATVSGDPESPSGYLITIK